MTVITRFAPSPTGFLHIGGGRTALFNWLFARHHGGQFLLRIEDTDRARSTQAAVDAILDGLRWLELDWDDAPVFQFARMARHAEVAHALLAKGHAYRCYASPDELQAMREKAKAEGRPMRYDGRWRDRDPADAPPGVKPVIRIKAPRTGETTIRDRVQGEVKIANEELDDMVLLRADGTPTYMLSVVVDDHDMAITHVIRGQDHLTNAFRQYHLYRAMDWIVPEFAHIPLIHAADGTKLSKRHGAIGIEAYRDMGYLQEAMRNYLLRLGWAHGDDEIISTEQAVAWFDLDAVGRSPARFDTAKLDHLNGYYLRAASDDRLVGLVTTALATAGTTLDGIARERLRRAIPLLKERTKTIVEIIDNIKFLMIDDVPTLDPKAAALLGADAKTQLRVLTVALRALSSWEATTLEETVRRHAESAGLKLKDIAQPLRAAVTGRTVSPPIFDVLAILGRESTLARLDRASA
ncbi:MAG: glutamate--tRNA ligase [Alphaproteobacteria bacterium]|nr:glutamate--tRNA ligase [Alphaproteobacteria bacterium]